MSLEGSPYEFLKRCFLHKFIFKKTESDKISEDKNVGETDPILLAKL